MSKRQRNVSPTSGSASRTSGSPMNTESNYNVATPSSSKSVKTAESGGSVGFSNGNIKRLGQSQSNSVNYQSAASSVSNRGQRKGSPMNTGSNSDEVTQPKSSLLRRGSGKRKRRGARTAQLQSENIKKMNEERKANEKTRAMKQIQEKIKAKEETLARVRALTNNAALQRKKNAALQRKKNIEAKKANIVKYIERANLFPNQKSAFLKEINKINFNNLKRMVNSSVEDKRRFNKVTGFGADNTRAAKEAENKKRENTITYIKTKKLTNNQIANLVQRVKNASPNNFDKIKSAANNAEKEAEKKKRAENAKRAAKEAENAKRAAKEAENAKRVNTITYIKTKKLTNNQIANLVQRVKNASPNNFDKIKSAANNAEKEAEKKGNTGQSSIKPNSGVTQAGGSGNKMPRTAAQGAAKFLKNIENITKQVNSLIDIDSLRKLAVKLGFRKTQAALKNEYKGKPDVKRLKVDLKNFISNPPPGTRINMSAVAQKTPGGTKRKANAAAQKTPGGKKRKVSAVPQKTPRGTTINARAEVNGLCNSEMSPVNDGHRKKLLKTKGLLKVYMSKIAMDKRKLFTKEKRCEVLDYIVKYNLTSGPQSVVRNIDTNTFINMLLIMWLDGVHDKYVGVTFNKWLQSYKDVFPPENYENDNYFIALKNATFVEGKTKNKGRRNVFISSGGKTFKILENAISDTIALELAETPGKQEFFAKRFINNLGFKGQLFQGFSAGWEKYFKSMVLLKYKRKNLVNTIDNPKDYRLKSVTPNDKMLLAVDQEYSSREERSLSRMIEGSDAVSPLITYGQAFDPGSTMLPFGIVKDIEGLMVLSKHNNGNIQNKPQFVSDASYYLEDFNITINCNNKPVIKIDFDSGSTTGESSLKLNGKELDLNVSAGQAKKNENAVNKISKYFGDALQYFIASQLTKPSDKVKTRKTINGGTRNYHFFLGSGDGMALFGYDFVCTQIFDNGAPNMVIDYSGGSSPKAHIINIDNSAFKLSKKEAKPTRTELITMSYMSRANNIGNTANSKNGT